MKARELLAVLCREPLGYSVVRVRGSHHTLEAEGRPRLTLALVIGAAVGGDGSSGTATERRSVDELVRDVCPEFSACGIDVDTDGPAYRFALLPDANQAGARALGVWGGATGCLEEIDVERIAQTRALDGMVESRNGRSTWTFHPDDGLVVVCSD